MIIVWRVTNECNLACPFCSYDKRLDIPRKSIEQERVTRFLAILAQYAEQTSDDVLVSWMGGEPLAWRDQTRLTLEARALGLNIGATTNGTLLGDESVRTHLREHYKELTISIDGFPGFYEPMRGWKNGYTLLGEWVRTLAREIAAAGSRLKLRANAILMRQNVAAFPDLCLALADWGFREITFNQLGGRDRPEFYPEHRLRVENIDDLANKLSEVRRVLSQRGVELVGGSRYLERLRASAIDRPNPIEECNPGDGFLFIDENGRIVPCNFTLDDYAIRIEEISCGADVRALGSMFREKRAKRRSNACADCLSTQVFKKFASK